jgi:N-acetylglucosamine-6-phosphate deacetylase
MQATWYVNGTFYTAKEVFANGRMLVNASGTIEYIGTDDSARAIAADEAVVDLQGGTVLPGMIDVHLHGGGGHYIMNPTYEDIDGVSRHYAAHGTTSFLATTAPVKDNRKLLSALENISSAMDQGVGGADILGVHLEGPFINPLRKGAMKVEDLRRVSLSEMQEYIDASGGTIRLVTMAPEIEDGYELARYLVERGITASIGHSDATYDEVAEAVRSGSTHTTHHFNGMRPLHHREPGVAGAGLMFPELTIELIADGIHVHPAVAKLMYDVKSEWNVCVITDAVQYAGLADGEYDDVTVKSGKIHLTGTDTLAGSSLTMIQALRNVLAFTGYSLDKVIPSFCLVPARQAGAAERKGSLETGKDADFILVSDELALVSTYVRGKLVFSR